MRYLIFLSGLNEKDKPKFEKEVDVLAEFKDLQLRNLYPDQGVAIMYITTNNVDVIEIKDRIKQISTHFNLTYFIQEHIDSLYMNLSDEDSEHLFGIAFDKIKDNENDFQRWLLTDDEEDFDDDDDIDLIQKLIKQKYEYKENAPTLDEILDKINQKGVSSLSIQEQSILKSYN